MTDEQIRFAESDAMEAKGTVSFSVRLTEKQRDLLLRAAETKGWTVTNLLKSAALEKAAFILNTAAPNRVDFPGLARQVADQLFAPRRARVPDPFHARTIVDADVFESFSDEPELDKFVFPVEVSPWRMPPDFASQIRDAARYGGTEFLNLIVEASEAIASRGAPSLPDPIDPSAL